MLATPSAEKRVTSLASMLKQRNFGIDEIKNFTDHWISTASKFPVMADIYAFLGKKIKINTECKGDGELKIQFDRYENDEHMARLKALNFVIEKWISEGKIKKLCCFFQENLEYFFDKVYELKENYKSATDDDVRKAMSFISFRLSNNGNKP